MFCHIRLWVAVDKELLNANVPKHMSYARLYCIRFHRNPQYKSTYQMQDFTVLGFIKTHNIKYICSDLQFLRKLYPQLYFSYHTQKKKSVLWMQGIDTTGSQYRHCNKVLGIYITYHFQVVKKSSIYSALRLHLLFHVKKFYLLGKKMLVLKSRNFAEWSKRKIGI